MALIVTGYVDGDPVYFEEPELTKFKAAANVEEKSSYEIGINAEDDHGNINAVHSVFYVPGEWIEPVWKRTKADVDYAVQLSNKILETGFSSLTSKEQADWTAGLIGCLSYWDLNRIEQNTKYLSDLLNSYGYNQDLTCKMDWLMTDFPYAMEMERIRSNIKALTHSYHAQDANLPDSLEKPDHRVINNLESILKLMKEMVHRMELGFRYSGTFHSGQEVAF